MKAFIIEQIDPAELMAHPLNIQLYGDEPDESLVESIKKHGMFADRPLGYVQTEKELLLVSGHRRRQAARLAGIREVPCVRLKHLEGDPLAIEEHLILSNRQREKTKSQWTAEFLRLKEIYAERAAIRERSGKKPRPVAVVEPQDDSDQHGPAVDNPPDARPEGQEEGDARDLAAASLGGHSGRSGDRGAYVLRYIDSLEKAGKVDEANALREHLNRSFEGAYEAVRAAERAAKQSTVKPAKRPRPPECERGKTGADKRLGWERSLLAFIKDAESLHEQDSSILGFDRMYLTSFTVGLKDAISALAAAPKYYCGCPLCDARGCTACKQRGWLDKLDAGKIRASKWPNGMHPLGFAEPTKANAE